MKTKNSYRNIAIGADTVRVLKVIEQKDEYVFPSPFGGPMSPDSILHMLQRVLKRAGLERIRFHDLRHTYAVFALQSGDDIKTVQENLGHVTAAFTLDIYRHVLDEMKQASASRMEKLIQGFASGQTDSGFAVSNA